MSEQAKRAYAKFAEMLYTPPWEELSEKFKEAWREAIAAAIDSPSVVEETLTEKQIRLLQEVDVVKLAKKLREFMPPDRGFLLWTVDYGPGGNIAYVATVGREDAIRTVREWLKHQGAL